MRGWAVLVAVLEWIWKPQSKREANLSTAARPYSTYPSAYLQEHTAGTFFIKAVRRHNRLLISNLILLLSNHPYDRGIKYLWNVAEVYHTIGATFQKTASHLQWKTGSRVMRWHSIAIPLLEEKKYSSWDETVRFAYIITLWLEGKETHVLRYPKTSLMWEMRQ